MLWKREKHLENLAKAAATCTQAMRTAETVQILDNTHDKKTVDGQLVKACYGVCFGLTAPPLCTSMFFPLAREGHQMVVSRLAVPAKLRQAQRSKARSAAPHNGATASCNLAGCRPDPTGN